MYMGLLLPLLDLISCLSSLHSLPFILYPPATQSPLCSWRNQPCSSEHLYVLFFLLRILFLKLFMWLVLAHHSVLCLNFTFSHLATLPKVLPNLSPIFIFFLTVISVCDYLIASFIFTRYLSFSIDIKFMRV